MGRKRCSKVKIHWSNKFAYAIGVLATDGNLSPDGRHLNLTSKDMELIIKFKDCLGLDNKIGRKARGNNKIRKYFVIQFGDVNFYEFLVNIGIGPAKSKTLSNIAIPDKYFVDFLRGCVDGDGSIVVSKHPQSSLPQLRLNLSSASLDFLVWIKSDISRDMKINGGWFYKNKRKNVFTLNFAKNDSINILRQLYKKRSSCYLDRKYRIAKKFLGE